MEKNKLNKWPFILKKDLKLGIVVGTTLVALAEALVFEKNSLSKDKRQYETVYNDGRLFIWIRYDSQMTAGAICGFPVAAGNRSCIFLDFSCRVKL